MSAQDGCQAPDKAKLSDEVDRLIAHLESTGRRFLLGITGCPGAGKTTTAHVIAEQVNAAKPNSAIVIGMDGFHLSNERLEQIGLLPLKGIPETFDAAGFVSLLQRLKTTTKEPVNCPLFDRSIEASIPDAITVFPEHRLCIVEGNYLLLDRRPWNQCRSLLDEIWYLQVPMEILTARLLRRHRDGGKDLAGAQAKVESTDLPNAKLIETTKSAADKVLSLS